MSDKLEVYNIIESKDGKSRWVKIGVGFENKDGSINVMLDVFPRDGKLQIRKPRPKKDEVEPPPF